MPARQRLQLPPRQLQNIIRCSSQKRRFHSLTRFSSALLASSTDRPRVILTSSTDQPRVKLTSSTYRRPRGGLTCSTDRPRGGLTGSTPRSRGWLTCSNDLLREIFDLPGYWLNGGQLISFQFISNTTDCLS